MSTPHLTETMTATPQMVEGLTDSGSGRSRRVGVIADEDLTAQDDERDVGVRITIASAAVARRQLESNVTTPAERLTPPWCSDVALAKI